MITSETPPARSATPARSLTSRAPSPSSGASDAPRSSGLGLLAAILLFALAGCLGDATLDEIDPEAAPAEPTYEAHIEPIMIEKCISCHAPDANVGELEGIGLDECEKVQDNLEIVSEMIFEKNSMPPGGMLRLTSEEKLTLQRWFDQGASCD